MAATSIYALPYPVPSDPADVPADMQRLANRVEGVFGPQTLTPPSSPRNGDYWVYPIQVADYGAWLFRWNGGLAPNGWMFLGGPPIAAEDWAGGQVNPTGGFVSWPGGAKTITVPRAGDYDIHWGFATYNSANAPADASFGLKFGTTAITEATGANWGAQGAGVGVVWSPSRKIRKTGLAAGTVIELQISVGGVLQAFSAIFMHVTPVRVA